MEMLIKTFEAIKDHLDIIFGSVLSLYFNRETLEALNFIKKVLILFAGIGVGHFFGGAIVEISGVDPLSFKSNAIKVLVAVYGMGILAQVNKNAPEQIEKTLTALRKKWFGE